MRPWTRILGIDPGSRVAGYGVIESNGQESRHVASGVINVVKAGDMNARLEAVFRVILLPDNVLLDTGQHKEDAIRLAGQSGKFIRAEPTAEESITTSVAIDL